MKFWLFLMITLISRQVAFSQVQFSNRNDLLVEREQHSAVPVGIADMNGDGLDDIISMDEGTELFIQYQTADTSRPFVRFNVPLPIDNEAQNDIIIADFNNDGANDILTVGSYDRVKILYNIPYTYEFDFTYLVVLPFFSQGASAGDFNGDGWVDVVLLNDNGLNYTLMNDGTGNLSHQTFFDFVTIPTSDNSGNYGSVYTDFDMDGDNDFYIAKCRQGVNNPNDPRRINVLFVNDGNNNYTERAKEYGLASGRQTWTTDFGDIDNDGDMDAFMTQHDVISELFENINNDTFINITATAGLNIGGIPLQGMFRDFDNDGFQDILVSGDRVDYYHNNGDKTFTREEPFGTIVFGTYGLGDFNDDGFTDVYASRVIPFNNPDLLREDILYLNKPNENHFLSLHVRDSSRNTSAIGAMAILYGEWGTQIRDVRGGEQYGVSNSHGMIFGLGEEETYDSLVIRWPDGTRERFDDLTADTHYYIERGGCYFTNQKLWSELDFICGNDSIILKIENGVTDVQWNTGAAGDSIIIKEAGIYFATFKNEGCLIRSIPIQVIKNPDTIMPVVIYGGETSLCSGESIELTLPQAQGYLWSTGETQQTIQVTDSGDYFAEVEGYCMTLRSDTLSLYFLEPSAPLVQNDTFEMGESATLYAIGDSIIWYDSTGIEIIGEGSLIVLDNPNDTTVVYAQNLVAIEGNNFQLGPVQQQGNPKYNAAFVNGGLIFDVLATVILEEFTMHTDSAGIRVIEISDGSGFQYQQEVELDSGANLIVLHLELNPGSYTISTNTDKNIEEFGTASPHLWRSSQGILYPYEINNVISITGSTFGEQYFYYFYDWKVRTPDHYCGSDLVPVIAFPDTEVGIGNPIIESEFLIMPNPADNLVQIYFHPSHELMFEIIDPNGTILNRKSVAPWANTISVALNEMPAGLYLVRLHYPDGIVSKKLIRL